MIPRVQLRDGNEMPVVGLGVREVEPDAVERVVRDAVDVGYRHFDCAAVHGNEAEVGAALGGKMREQVVSRKDLFVTTKLWNTCHRPGLVVPACRSSLKRLGLDYLDLYLMHWPIAFKGGAGEDFPRDDEGRLVHEDVDYLLTYREMEECVRLGLARSIGLANFNSEQVARVMSVATIPPVNNQVECHPYLNQLTLAKFCSKRDIVVTGFSPLGAPSPVPGISGTPSLLTDARLRPLCAKYKKTPAQIVLRYLVQRGTYPLPKTQDKDHMIENLQIFDFDLSLDDMHNLDVFDSRMRFYPFTESKEDYNYPFGVDF